MSILIKGMDMLKDGTYTSNIHVKGGEAILDNPIGLGYFELVEVVQCKDCKYRKFIDWGMGDCVHPKGSKHIAYDYHYCSYGERREQ